MPEIKVNIEVYCAKCGAGLCGNTYSKKTNYHGSESFYVEPCGECLKEAEDDGYNKGHEAALLEE